MVRNAEACTLLGWPGEGLGLAEEMIEMSSSRQVYFVAFPQPVPRIAAQRLQQPVAGAALCRLGDYQRLANETAEHVKRIRTTHRIRRGEVKAAGEDSEPSK